MMQFMQTCDGYLLPYVLGFISLGDGVFQFGSSCKRAKGLLEYANTWAQLSFQPRPCNCRTLCTQRIMTCLCLGTPGRQCMIVEPPRVLSLQPFMRMFTREIDGDFIVWKLRGCDMTAVSLHLHFPAATKEACLAIGWCTTTVTDTIINAAMSGYPQFGGIWHADFYRDSMAWNANGRRLRSEQMQSVPGTLGIAKVYMTAQPRELALFAESGVVNKARVPTSFRFDPSAARTFFVMYVAEGKRMKRVARTAQVRCLVPTTEQGHCYSDVLRNFV